MNSKKAEDLHHRLLESATDVLSRGQQHAAILILNPLGGKGSVVLIVNDILNELGKAEGFAALRRVCMAKKYALVAFVDEAHVLDLDPDEDVDEFMAGKRVRDIEGSYDAIVIHIETVQRTWVWTHRIITDDAGNRLIDTTVKPPAGTAGDGSSIKFLS